MALARVGMPEPVTGLSWPQVVLMAACIVGCALVVAIAVARSTSERGRGSSCQARAGVTYTSPPQGYTQPAVCQVCRKPIRLTPILGGAMWTHVTPPLDIDHPVLMRSDGWWDVTTGRILHGITRVDPGPPL